MVFPAVAGHAALPNGNWSPVIFSKKAQLAFRKESVASAITNTDYIGEVSNIGDTVRIIMEPDVEVRPYARGQQIEAQDLDDEEMTLIVDQSNFFAFKVDDIEAAQSHIGWESLASNRAAYKMKDAMDSEVLTYMSGEVVSSMTVGTTGTPTQIRQTGGDFTPTRLFNRMHRLLDQQNVPKEGRWAVVDPVFEEIMRDDDSKLLSDDYVEKGALNNGKIINRPVMGFTLYGSQNLPSAGTGPTATSGANYGVILVGHMSSTASAQTIKKVENYRDQNSFADVVRGMHIYGRKVLRTESICQAYYQS